MGPKLRHANVFWGGELVAYRRRRACGGRVFVAEILLNHQHRALETGLCAQKVSCRTTDHRTTDNQHIHVFHQSTMQFIAKEDVERLAPYGALVEALAKGLREPIESPPRSHFNPNHDASAVLIMPAW
eukprot:gene58227-77695_t